MTTTNFERLKEIRKQVNNIREIVERFSYPTEYTRLEYLFSELDTLMVISEVIKNKSYKESFILLRSSFEKFLFFWLMFEGKIYRFSQIVKIHPKTNSTPQQARDKTFLLYKSEKEKGNPLFKDVSIDKRGENKIILTYQWIGLYEKNDLTKSGLIIPFYNFILNEYSPDMAHLEAIDTIEEGVINKDIIISQQEIHKIYYNKFFYFKSLIKNLFLNNLSNEDQKNRINIHYNFLSRYVHPRKYNIDIKKENKNGENNSQINKLYEDLIFLYVSRLMYLYLKIYVSHFKNGNTQNLIIKYENFIEELDRLSEDLWFFDNNPTPYDIRISNEMNYVKKQMNVIQPHDVIYYHNPLERLRNLRLNQSV